MQPTFMPWIGYFDLMNRVDTFVYLDNVKFSKQSWQQRNRIKTPNGYQWITIPVSFSEQEKTQIIDANISMSSIVRKQIRAIDINYHKAPFFGKYFPRIKEILNDIKTGTKLIDINVTIIEWICNELKIKTKCCFASDIVTSTSRGQRLVSICNNLNADNYLSPLGSVNYLKDETSDFYNSNISIYIHNFIHPVYTQLYPPFLSHCSALDLLMNEGEDSMKIIQSGHRDHVLFDDIYNKKSTIDNLNRHV